MCIRFLQATVVMEVLEKHVVLLMRLSVAFIRKKIKCNRVCLSGSAPLLLLPENIRIRKFNLQAETFHDFLEEEEHIMALDYDFDHNNTGFSRLHTD